MATSSLSFSRGVRFIVASIEPEPRQFAAECGQNPREIAAQDRAILGAEPCHRKPVPGGETDFSRKTQSAHPLDRSIVHRRDQHRRNRNAAATNSSFCKLLRYRA